MSEIHRRISNLSKGQRELLGARLRGKNATTAGGVATGDLRVSDVQTGPVATSGKKRQLDFGLFFFSADGTIIDRNKYSLLMDCARFADQHGFRAIWVPERHFQSFGGLYPNPSVLAAAISAITSHIRIRAGSVVAPLHHPIRIAEEWSVVDNLSGGRVEISFASGYHPGDFTLAPECYADRKEIMFRHIEAVRKLWSGEEVSFPGVDGHDVRVRTLPRPLQQQLPVWITSAGSGETWRRAAEMGAHVLTGPAGIGQRSIEDLADKISRYRKTLAACGHDPDSARVALMVHTYIGRDVDVVREAVRQPILEYVASFMAQEGSLVAPERRVAAGLSDQDQECLKQLAFNRFLDANALFGTVEECSWLAESFQYLGVDELACLVDFGLNHRAVLDGLELLDDLYKRFCRGDGALEIS